MKFEIEHTTSSKRVLKGILARINNTPTYRKLRAGPLWIKAPLLIIGFTLFLYLLYRRDFLYSFLFFLGAVFSVYALLLGIILVFTKKGQKYTYIINDKELIQTTGKIVTRVPLADLTHISLVNDVIIINFSSHPRGNLIFMADLTVGTPEELYAFLNQKTKDNTPT